MKGRSVLKGVQVLGGVLALAILAWTVRSAWAELSTGSYDFGLGRAGLAVLGLALAYLGTVGIWKMLFADLGVPVRFSDALQLWSFSNLGRYLPGKVWQVVGMVVVAKDLGIPPGVAAAAAFINLGFQICTGALVGLVLFPSSFARLEWSGPVLTIIAAGVLVPLAWPAVLNGILGRLPAALGCSQTRPLARSALLRLAVAHIVIWLVHGAMFLLFAGSFGAVSADAYPRFAGTYALAYVVGLIAVFAPGGIGVREGMIGVLLGATDAIAIPVHALAVAARLWAIAAEVVVLAAALVMRFSRPGRRP